MKKYKYIILGILTIMLMGIKGLSFMDNIYSIKELGINRSAIVLNDSTSFEVDNVLLPYVKEFVDDYIAEEGYSRLEYFSRSYMGIYLDITPNYMWGVTYFQKPYGDDYSLITPLIEKSDIKLRNIVFHEMAHKFLNRGHCHKFCNQILSAEITNYSFYNDWEKQKKILFSNKKHDSIPIFKKK